MIHSLIMILCNVYLPLYSVDYSRFSLSLASFLRTALAELGEVGCSCRCDRVCYNRPCSPIDVVELHGRVISSANLLDLLLFLLLAPRLRSLLLHDRLETSRTFSRCLSLLLLVCGCHPAEECFSLKSTFLNLLRLPLLLLLELRLLNALLFLLASLLFSLSLQPLFLKLAFLAFRHLMLLDHLFFLNHGFKLGQTTRLRAFHLPRSISTRSLGLRLLSRLLFRLLFSFWLRIWLWLFYRCRFRFF